MASHRKKQKPRYFPKRKIRCWAQRRSRAAASVSMQTTKLVEEKEFGTRELSVLRPIKIHSNALLEIWQKHDSSNTAAESTIYFHYISSILFETTENVAMFDLFVKVVKNVTKKLLDPLLFDDVDSEISAGVKGLSIRAKGYNPKLPIILKHITSYVAQCRDFLNDDLFDFVKKENLRMYHRNIMDPKKLIEDVRQSLTILYYWTNAEMYEALSRIELEQFQDFCEHFADHMYVQCFVQGNMERADVVALALACVDILDYHPLPPNTMPQHSINEIPRGLHGCRVRGFDPQNSQSFVSNYYQFQDPSFKLSAMLDYLRLVMEQFLPSDVECDLLRGNFGMFGYAIMGTVVEGDAVEDVDCRIEIFRRFFNETFRNMKTDQLLRIKRIFIAARTDDLREIDRAADERENWNEIITGKYCFNREARELEVMKKITSEELRMWMTKFTAGEDDCHLRKISIQVVGHDAALAAAETRASDNNNGESTEFALRYLTSLSEDTTRTTGYDRYITDIDEFRQSLNIIPWESSSR